jgi:tetratricopeptide (TPR) repeat protein
VLFLLTLAASQGAEEHFRAGLERGRRGDWPGAIESFTRVIELDPENAAAHCNRAIGRAKKKDFDGAIQDYTRALELRPLFVEALAQRGALFLLAGEAQKAAEDLSGAIRLDPRKGEPYALRAFVRLQAGDADGATRDAATAMALDRSLAPEASVVKAALHAATGREQAALDEADAALRAKPDLAYAQLIRAGIFLQRKDADRCAQAATAAIESGLRSGTIHRMRAAARRLKSDHAGAVEDLEQALLRMPPSAPLFLELALARSQKGDLEGAIAACGRAIELDPVLAAARVHRAILKFRKKDLQGAVADSTDAIRLDPKEADGYLARAYALGRTEGSAGRAARFGPRRRAGARPLRRASFPRNLFRLAGGVRKLD